MIKRRRQASGANTALSNLASVAINTALLDDAAAADDFGSATLPWKDIFLAGSSGTPGTNNFRLTGASTSGTRVITLPDASATLLYNGGPLGTPASGTMTNVTGLTEAGQTLADNTTNDVSTTKHGYAPKAPNDTTKFLRGDATWAQPSSSGSSTVMRLATSFETAGRFGETLTNAGSASFGTQGLQILTSATATSGTLEKWAIATGNGNGDVMPGSPLFSAHIYGVTIGTDFDYGIGLANWTATGGAVAFTVKHAGFKIVRRSSGTVSLFATQADGTTENASAALLTFAADSDVDIIMKVNSTTSVDYYTRNNGAASLSAATNLTSNMPGDVAQGTVGIIISNAGVASNSRIGISGMSYER